jgi:hypothetical protein
MDVVGAWRRSLWLLFLLLLLLLVVVVVAAMMMMDGSACPPVAICLLLSDFATPKDIGSIERTSSCCGV